MDQWMVDEPNPREDLRVSVATNAVGWALYAEDGREVGERSDGVPTIIVSDEETAAARAIAERVVAHLDALAAST